ncbi:MAG: isoleucine--tRNA ligase [Clostridiaceae bacterium]|jgi:isoleucyl-tRNA synthetase|nr:isoleucine--tRNA ligase [Clostridiaceae bacterium]
MYKPVNTNLNFVEREREITEFWKENQIFEKSVKKNDAKEEFCFYDGPPTANGRPHIGHVLTRVIKDLIPRYKNMKGYHVQRKAGWDTHGLPVELEVEKILGLDGKQDIEKYGIEPFIKKCKESVWKYTREWEQMSDKVGYWVDMKHPYVTYDDNYIESVWWSVKEIDKKGLIYKGHKIVPYCPRCGTALSSHEVAQGYKDVAETSVFVKFRAKGEENTYFLAWTTTPWTLPSNVALCMNPAENYSKIKVGDAYYYLADALISSLFTEYEKIETKKGKDYEYKEYLPLFDFYTGNAKAYYITCDNYVTLTDGSGIVHIAPAFGEDDSNVGKAYGLPFVQMVNERGRFVAGTGDLEGLFAKEADKVIISSLKEQGLLFKEMQFTHSYPFCWRCDTPLLYYARSSWFIKMTAVRDELVKNSASVNWLPPAIGAGRMGNFLENVIDWGFSRERYWGTPIPIWVCKECGHTHTVGSRAELNELAGLKENIELHRPYIDAVTFKCPHCGGEMKRTPEVMDCWYDSGSMPFAQLHYPFENADVFEKQLFPADFISEAVDQTRGWFYTLLAISTLLFGRSPFKNCIVLGHVNDKEGVKMSKHKGNVIAPDEVLDKQGADAVRWYFYTASAPWLPSRFSHEAVSEMQRKFLGTLWNTYAFFVLYAEIDGYNPSEYKLSEQELSVMDRWLLAELNSLIRFVDENMAEYKLTESARKIQEFTDNLSNWYVRRSRERFWGKDMTPDKAAAYTTLWTALTELSKVAAPFVPFMTESIYQNLVTPFFKDAPESVHLCDFPTADARYDDAALEIGMESVLKTVVLGRAARNKANIKNRQPLSKLLYKGDISGLTPELKALAEDELNVREITEVANEREFIVYELKPQLKTLGPKYGKLLNQIRTYLDTADGGAIVDATENGGVFTARVGEAKFSLSRDDILISARNKTGFASESGEGLTVILNTNITEELLLEGIERELVSKIQTMRKEAGYEVTDHIKLAYAGSGKALEVLEGKAFFDDVLADGVLKTLNGKERYVKQWDINGESITLSIKKVVKRAKKRL